MRTHLDIVIVGAGFAGMYMLHRARGLGLAAHVFEAGSGVGGTWYAALAALGTGHGTRAQEIKEEKPCPGQCSSPAREAASAAWRQACSRSAATR